MIGVGLCHQQQLLVVAIPTTFLSNAVAAVGIFAKAASKRLLLAVNRVPFVVIADDNDPPLTTHSLLELFQREEFSVPSLVGAGPKSDVFSLNEFPFGAREGGRLLFNGRDEAGQLPRVQQLLLGGRGLAVAPPQPQAEAEAHDGDDEDGDEDGHVHPAGQRLGVGDRDGRKNEEKDERGAARDDRAVLVGVNVGFRNSEEQHRRAVDSQGDVNRNVARRKGRSENVGAHNSRDKTPKDFVESEKAVLKVCRLVKELRHIRCAAELRLPLFALRRRAGGRRDDRADKAGALLDDAEE